MMLSPSCSYAMATYVIFRPHSYSSRGIGGGKLPWRIHHNHVVIPSDRFKLLLPQRRPIECPNICIDRDAEWWRVILRQQPAHTNPGGFSATQLFVMHAKGSFLLV